MTDMSTLAIVIVVVIAGGIFLALMVYDFLSRTELDCIDEAICGLIEMGRISPEEAERRLAGHIERMKAEGRWPPPTHLQDLRSKA